LNMYENHTGTDINSAVEQNSAELNNKSWSSILYLFRSSWNNMIE